VSPGALPERAVQLVGSPEVKMDAEKQRGPMSPGSTSLSLDDLLRFALSGGVFVLALHWLCPDRVKELATWPGAVIVLTLGAFTYGLHRFFHVYLLRFALVWVRKGRKGPDERIRMWSWSPRPTDFEMCAFRMRWKLLRSEDRVYGWLQRWSSQTHFLYTVPFAYWLACGVTWMFGCHPQFTWTATGVSLALVLLAWVDDFRSASVHLHLIEMEGSLRDVMEKEGFSLPREEEDT
jgi:hypothetical protein